MTAEQDAPPDTLAECVTRALADWSRQHGHMVTTYAGIFNFIGADGKECWARVIADGQTYDTTLGLLRFHTIHVEEATRAYFADG